MGADCSKICGGQDKHEMQINQNVIVDEGRASKFGMYSNAQFIDPKASLYDTISRNTASNKGSTLTKINTDNMNAYRYNLPQVTKIQAVYRGYIARRKFKEMISNRNPRNIYRVSGARFSDYNFKQKRVMQELQANPFDEKSCASSCSECSSEEVDCKTEERADYTFKNGSVYKGEWKGTKRHGYGIQYWPDGARYEGNWFDNKAHGKGKFWHVDGDIYDGEWKEDKANGYGVYTHYNGAQYEGEWLNDIQHGYGKEKWTDGSSYLGYYLDGKKHGTGKYIWSDGSYYDGDWIDNRIEGKGEYFWPDGRKYVGGWRDNAMHGYGVYTWKDGRRYEGEYKMDKKHGRGTYTWVDGKIYEGEWREGKQHGRGRYLMPDGSSKYGIWENGKRIRWDDSENNNKEEVMSKDEKSPFVVTNHNAPAFANITNAATGHVDDSPLQQALFTQVSYK